MTVTIASYSATALAFLALTLLLLRTSGRSAVGHALLAASGLSALWAIAAAANAATDTDLAGLADFLEALRTLAWLVFLSGLVGRFAALLTPVRLRIVAVALAAVAALLGLTENTALGPALLGTSLPTVHILSRLGFAVIGLVFIENIFRNADASSLWSLKHLVLGCGTIFVFDFYLYSDALLFNRVDPALQDTRGVINALAAPLLAVAAVRNRDWRVNIHVSRKVVFHTATIVGSGIYLLAMAAAGYYFREIGGSWGPVIQIAFLSAAVILMLVALFSESARAGLKLLISRHFFSYRYDYRDEWHAFIATMSSGEGRLYDRAIRAVARVVDSPSGALWVENPEERAFFPMARWNLAEKPPVIATDAPLVEHLRQEEAGPLDLKAWRNDRAARAELELPSWLSDNGRARLVVPLRHRDRLLGLLLLGEPRMPQKLTWEEHDLLRTLSRQVASYLAEEEALKALVDARQFEEFNRRFAFVIHDIKNVAGQLSLVLANAEKHWDNPAFQKDAMGTVRNSVDKMNALLGQLRGQKAEPSRPAAPTRRQGSLQPLDAAALLRRVATPYLNGSPRVDLVLGAEPADVLADQEKLTAVLSHLLQNAVEAAGGEGQVLLRLHRGKAADVAMEVVDDGPGMDEAFVRDQLFRPLRSTKTTGFGIGAYQTRELVREMGGRLEVETSPGQGTTMRVLLRRATVDDQQSRQVAVRVEE